MSWSFVSLDVETANSDPSSICQVGIVMFENGIPIDALNIMINPETHFDSGNVAIHGIKPLDVVGKPTFADAFSQIQKAIESRVVVHHGPFDVSAFNGAYKKYGLVPIDAIWLNNFLVVRHTWDQFFHRGYALNNLARHFGLQLQHHDALSDARVAGQIACLAFNESNMSPQLWAEKYQSKRKFKKPQKPNEPSKTGKFFGKTILLTGDFNKSKLDLENAAASVGFQVVRHASKKLDLLVVGAVDLDATKGKPKTGKHLKIEELIAQGEQISIIVESQFDDLIEFGKR